MLSLDPRGTPRTGLYRSRRSGDPFLNHVLELDNGRGSEPRFGRAAAISGGMTPRLPPGGVPTFEAPARAKPPARRATRRSGPGAWIGNLHGGTNMSDAARAYQRQITGVSPRSDYVVKRGNSKVDFDGYRNGTLLDAKYWTRDGREMKALRVLDPASPKAKPPSPGAVYWASGVAQRILDDANRHVRVAGGTPVAWHVPDADSAQMLRRMFGTMGVPITVQHTPDRG